MGLVSRVAASPDDMRHLALRLSQYGLVFVCGIVIARELGPEGRAEYALPLALATTVQLTIHLSIEHSAGRMLARRDAGLMQLTRLVSALTALLAVAGIALTVGIGLAAGDALLAGASPTALGLAAATVPFGLVQTMSGGFLLRTGALRAYGWIVAGSAAVQLAALVVLAAAADLTPESALAATLLGWAVGGMAMAVVLRRRVGRGALLPRLDRGLARQAVRDGLLMHPAAIGLYLNLRIDLFLVALLMDARAAGLYSLAASLAEVVFLAAFTLAQAAMQAQTEESERAAAQVTLRYVRQSLTLGIVLAAATAVAAYPLVIVVYGREWLGSVAPLIILSFAAAVLAVEAPMRTFLARVLRPAVTSVPAVVALLLNVAANLVLIPLMGIVGAAVASLLSYLAYALVTLRLFDGASPLPSARRQLWKWRDAGG